MTVMNNTSDRLRRATQLWHAYLSVTGERFDLAQFLKDPVIETQAIDRALGSGDAKLIVLAQDWLRDTGQAVPKVIASRVVAPAPPAAPAPETPAKPPRYLRGVR